MKFVTTVIMLLLHLSGFAQISVNIYAHLTQPGSIGTLSFDQTISLSTAPLDADGGPVYRARADHMPPYVLYRNNAWLGTVSSDNIYPVSTNRGELRFYGSERSMGYFSVRYVYEMVAPNQVSAGASAATQTCANASMELRSTDNWPITCKCPSLAPWQLTESVFTSCNDRGTASFTTTTVSLEGQAG